MNLDLTDAQRSFLTVVQAFADDVVAPRAAAIDETDAFPADVMREAANRGLLGITTPQQWGGLGLDYVSYALAIEAVSRASATVAVSMVVHHSLVSDLIAYAGRTSQKEQWLRRLASGDALGAFALSEPDAGTDAANQQTILDLLRKSCRDSGVSLLLVTHAPEVASQFDRVEKLADFNRPQG